MVSHSVNIRWRISEKRDLHVFSTELWKRKLRMKYIFILHWSWLRSLLLFFSRVLQSRRQKQVDPHSGFLIAATSIQTSAFVCDSRADGRPYAFWPALHLRNYSFNSQIQENEKWRGEQIRSEASQIPVRLLSHYGSHSIQHFNDLRWKLYKPFISGAVCNSKLDIYMCLRNIPINAFGTK